MCKKISLVISFLVSCLFMLSQDSQTTYTKDYWSNVGFRFENGIKFVNKDSVIIDITPNGKKARALNDSQLKKLNESVTPPVFSSVDTVIFELLRTGPADLTPYPNARTIIFLFIGKRAIDSVNIKMKAIDSVNIKTNYPERIENIIIVNDRTNLLFGNTFYKLTNLKELYLLGSVLISKEISNLKKLRKLILLEPTFSLVEDYYAKNTPPFSVNLSYFPYLESFVAPNLIDIQYKQLSSLRNLREMHIERCTPKQFNKYICSITSLEELQIQDMYDDFVSPEFIGFIHSIPPRIGNRIAKLSNLRVFKLFSGTSCSFEPINDYFHFRIPPINKTEYYLLNTNYRYRIFISPQIGKLQKLETLDIQGTYFDAKLLFPNTIHRCRNLKNLTITRSYLNTFPKLSDMPNLEYVDLSINHIKTISIDIQTLPKLKRIDLSHNLIKSIPNGLADKIYIHP